MLLCPFKFYVQRNGQKVKSLDKADQNIGNSNGGRREAKAIWRIIKETGRDLLVLKYIYCVLYIILKNIYVMMADMYCCF